MKGLTVVRLAPLSPRLSFGAVLLACAALSASRSPARAAETGNDWPAPVPGHVPVRPGEHPRLIFRRAEIATLRERAKTPMGREVIERIRKAMRLRADNRENIKDLGYQVAGHGALYVLTGDAGRAATARVELSRKFTVLGFERLLTTLEQSNRLLGVALAYDLCCDAWDEASRAKMAGSIEGRAKHLLEGSRKSKRPPWDGMRAIVYASVGTAALAILDDPGASADVKGILAECEKEIRRYLTLAMSPRGSCVEGEGIKHMTFASGLFPFLHAYGNVMGKDLASTPGVRQFLPMLVMLTVPGVGTPQFGRAGAARDRSGVFAMGFGSTPERYRPAVLWLYERVVGEKHYDVTRPHHGLYMLLDYPYGFTAADPGGVLPKVLADDTRGVYVFRKGWRDEDDFVAVADLALPPAPGASPVHTVGGIRIWGLGRRWASREGPHAHMRWVIPEGRIDNSAAFSGKLYAVDVTSPPERVHFSSREDGSGVVSVKHAGVVRRTVKTTRRKIKGKKVNVDVPKGGEFEALRSFAVDYSGRSGAPGLYVTADRLTGGGAADRAWVLHVGCFEEMRVKANVVREEIDKATGEIGKARRDRKIPSEERDARIGKLSALVAELKAREKAVKEEYYTVRDRSFTLRGGDGTTMKGTLVAPAGARFEQSINYPWWSFIYVRGQSECLVVMTVQRGEAPEVKVEGSGLGAKVTVGAQTVRFDGEKVVLGR